MTSLVTVRIVLKRSHRSKNIVKLEVRKCGKLVVREVKVDQKVKYFRVGDVKLPAFLGPRIYRIVLQRRNITRKAVLMTFDVAELVLTWILLHACSVKEIRNVKDKVVIIASMPRACLGKFERPRLIRIVKSAYSIWSLLRNYIGVEPVKTARAITFAHFALRLLRAIT